MDYHQQTKTLPNSTAEEIIARQIEGIKKMIWVHGGPEEEEEEEERDIQINPAMKRHWELEIKTLQDAPKDADKLRKLLEAKRKEYEESEDYETRCRLVTEIEMLRFVLCVVCGNNNHSEKNNNFVRK
ncbi:MAG: hypothetical protein M3270_10340 [Thermoproteota archaeon]|nr:hypothetical protein [Thermoproteota archaeon]